MTTDPALVPVAQASINSSGTYSKSTQFLVYRLHQLLAGPLAFDAETIKDAIATIADHARIVAELEATIEREQGVREDAQRQLRALRARVDAAPVVEIDSSGELVTLIAEGSELDNAIAAARIDAMHGQRVRLLAAPAGGEG